MDSTIWLPYELWGEILQHVSQDVLPDATLTCQAFRRLGVPRLFRTFKFHPYFIHIAMFVSSRTIPQTRLMPTDEVTDNAMQRLRFYGSQSISLYVQRCEVRPWQITNLEHEHHFGTSSPDLLLDAFLELLPQFYNLRQLDCDAVNFDRRALSQLSLLPNIHEIVVRACNLLGNIWTLPIIPMRAFQLSSIVRSISSTGTEKWLRVLDPHRLERLSVGPSRATTALFGTITTLPSFSSIQNLSLDISSTIIPNLPAILQQTPSVRRLKIGHSNTQDSDRSKLAARQIPNSVSLPLVHYDGPYELLHAIITEELCFLSLHSFAHNGCDPEDLTNLLLSRRRRLENLTFFQVELPRLRLAFFSIICSLFPRLKTICIEEDADGGAFTPAGFLEDLPIDTLPDSLEHFIMAWTAQDYKDAVSKSALFKDKVFAQRPSLKVIWLSDTGHLAFGCKRDAVGRESMVMVERGLSDIVARNNFLGPFSLHPTF